jgi:hypothetical protein
VSKKREVGGGREAGKKEKGRRVRGALRRKDEGRKQRSEKRIRSDEEESEGRGDKKGGEEWRAR